MKPNAMPTKIIKDGRNKSPAMHISSTEVNQSHTYRARHLTRYWCFVVLRFLLATLPQNGYVHPDEFFQSMEVMIGDVFELDVNKPWEFNTTFPLRSVAMPYLTVAVPCKILKFISELSHHCSGIKLESPYLLLVIPRLTVCFASFLCDVSLWKMCCIYGQNYATRLKVFASSYAVLLFGSRTFSNTTEMILFSVLLCLVVDSMHFSDEVIWQEDKILEMYEEVGRDRPVERARLTRLRSSLPTHSMRHCMPIAFITLAGIFNRPTFIAFASPALFSWIYRGMGSKSIGWSHFHLRIIGLSFFGSIAAILFVCIDSVYYGYLTTPEIINFEVYINNNFVVTPLNFLKYNAKSSNLAKHGLHPWWLHLVVNMPLLFSLLGLFALLSMFNIIIYLLSRKWSLLPRVQSINALMHSSILVPLAILSAFPHQEPRFLLPLIVPLTFLHAQSLCLLHAWLLPIWYTINALSLLIFGFIHQGGVWGLLVHLHETGLSNPAPLNSVHIITSHIYSMPKFPLMLPSTSKVMIGPGGRRYRQTRRFHLHEAGTSDLLGAEIAHSVLSQCANDWEKYRLKCQVFCVYPAPLQEKFEQMSKTYKIIPNTTHKMFYPHISTEAMPSLWPYDSSYRSLSSFLTKKLGTVGLVLTSVNLCDKNSRK